MIIAYFDDPKKMVEVFAKSIADFDDTLIIDIGYEDCDIAAAIEIGWESASNPTKLKKKSNLDVLWHTIRDSWKSGPAIRYFFNLDDAKVFCTINCVGIKLREENRDRQTNKLIAFVNTVGLQAKVFETSELIDREVVANACCRSRFPDLLWQGRPLHESS